jgi:foldase protein PrsA
VLPRKLLLIVALCAALGATTVACSNGATGSPPAATVGSTQISDAQLAKESELFTFLSALNSQKCGTVEGTETQTAACSRFTLQNMIETVIVSQYATQHKLSVDPKILQTTLDNLDAHFGKAAVDSALASNHLTRDDLTAVVREILLYQVVGDDLTKAQITNQQLHQLYQQQIAQFTTIDVEHILVKTEAEAEHAYKVVTAPGATEQTFLRLAKAISIDPSAKQNSGHLPAQSAGSYVAPFAQAALALKPGEISKPVQSQYGWHVIRLVSKKVTPFTQAESQLLQAKRSQVFNSWLLQQAAELKISVDPKFGKYNSSALTVDRISSTESTPSTAAPATP